MTEERRIFERRRTEYLQRAEDTMQQLNDAVGKFNGTMYLLRIRSVSQLRLKSAEAIADTFCTFRMIKHLLESVQKAE